MEMRNVFSTESGFILISQNYNLRNIEPPNVSLKF